MRVFAIQIGIWSAALVGIAAIAAFGQSSPVLTGTAAYGDWRSDAPGVRRKITATDMPPPYATPSVSNGPTVLARPANAWPKAPPGFVVELVAEGLDNPRLLRVSPSGDVFVAESRPGRVRVLRLAQGSESLTSAYLRRTSTSRLASLSGRRDQTPVTCMWRIPIAWSDFPIARAIFNPPAQQRRLSLVCRRADIRRGMSSSPTMGPGCLFQ